MTDTRPFDHQQYKDLLAAFALDALDDEERLDVADHLLECDSCTTEVDTLLDTTSLLALSESEPPPASLWNRIETEMRTSELKSVPTSAPTFIDQRSAAGPNSPERPPLSTGGTSDAGTELLAPVINLADRRRLKPWMAAVAGAAAASALVIPITRSTLTPKTSGIDVAQLAAAQEKTPGTRRIDLLTTDGSNRNMGDVIVTRDGKGYIRMHDAEHLADDRTYQLWTIVDGKPVSAGLLGTNPSVAAFAISSNAVAVAVSVEKSTGATTPEVGAIAVATL